ncbi:UNVERIFIED_CONTAM: hypothetical protein H355_008917 [Colinus virginianus]|nr:hypothetical protein H355_008917 [Colinus virginianus]
MYLKRPAGGLAFCLFYLASCFTNKYVLSVLKFTYPTLFQGSEILSWLPASLIFVGVIYAGSRALSRLPIPVFLTLHNAAEFITCGFQKFVQKEFDPNGYLWALIHLLCVVTWTNSTSTMYSGNCGVKPTYCGGLLANQHREVVNVWWTLGILSDVAHSEAKKQHNLRAICSMEFPCKGEFNPTSSTCCEYQKYLQEVITASLSPFFFAMTANVLTVSCHARQHAQYILSYACDEDLKADGSELVQHHFGLYREAKCTVL